MYKFGYTGEGFATMSTNIRDFSNLIFATNMRCSFLLLILVKNLIFVAIFSSVLPNNTFRLFVALFKPIRKRSPGNTNFCIREKTLGCVNLWFQSPIYQLSETAYRFFVSFTHSYFCKSKENH